ncbi:Pepco domain-containing protein [Actinoplanes sp. CA-131856]
MKDDLAGDGATLNFLVAADEETGGGTKGIFSRGDRDVVLRDISVETVQRNLASTIGKLREAFSGLRDAGGDLPLKSVEVSFEISATGTITILGTGVETSGTGGITLTFERG